MGSCRCGSGTATPYSQLPTASRGDTAAAFRARTTKTAWTADSAAAADDRNRRPEVLALGGEARLRDDQGSGPVPGQTELRQAVTQRVQVPEIHVATRADDCQTAAL